MISHNMEELAEICDRLYVTENGQTVLHGTPAVVFGQSMRLRSMGLDVPAVTILFEQLAECGALPAMGTVYTVEQAEDLLLRSLGEEQL